MFQGPIRESYYRVAVGLVEEIEQTIFFTHIELGVGVAQQFRLQELGDVGHARQHAFCPVSGSVKEPATVLRGDAIDSVSFQARLGHQIMDVVAVVKNIVHVKEGVHNHSVDGRFIVVVVSPTVLVKWEGEVFDHLHAAVEVNLMTQQRCNYPLATHALPRAKLAVEVEEDNAGSSEVLHQIAQTAIRIGQTVED